MQGYGYSSLPDVNVTRDTLWHGGSTTKAMLDATLARIINDKTYPAIAAKGWKTRVSDIIGDDFALQDEWATRHLTLEDAASHRSGMPRHDFSWITANDSRSPQEMVRKLRYLPPSAEPRETYQYCNLMYIALTHVLETLTGTDWWSAAMDILFKPLGMASSYGDLEVAAKSGHPVAKGYYWDASAESFKLPPQKNFISAFGAGAMVSTVDDYLRWVRYAMKSGPVQDELRKVRTLVSEMQLNVVPVGYALGWAHGIIQGHKAWFHSGGTSAHGAEVYWMPDLEWGLVSFCNTAGCNAPMESIALRLLEEKLGTPEEHRHEPPSLPEPDGDYLEMFYPDVPKVRLPSPVSPKELVGTYHDNGYGTLKVQQDGGKLVGLFVGMEHDLVFEHVSGEYWMGMGCWPQRAATRDIPAAIQFVTGVDGKANSVIMTQTPPEQQTPSEGPVTFQRVES